MILALVTRKQWFPTAISPLLSAVACSASLLGPEGLRQVSAVAFCCNQGPGWWDRGRAHPFWGPEELCICKGREWGLLDAPGLLWHSSCSSKQPEVNWVDTGAQQDTQGKPSCCLKTDVRDQGATSNTAVRQRSLHDACQAQTGCGACPAEKGRPSNLLPGQGAKQPLMAVPWAWKGGFLITLGLGNVWEVGRGKG